MNCERTTFGTYRVRTLEVWKRIKRSRQAHSGWRFSPSNLHITAAFVRCWRHL